MHRLILPLLLWPVLAWSLDYPESPRQDVVDTYHGVEVADPYRWLEDVDAPEVAQWVQAQNRLTRSVLQQLPGRDRLRKRLSTLWKYEKFGLPQEVGGALFYRYSDGQQDQAVLMRQSADGTRQLVLDPNQLSADGTAALTAWEVSPDGRYLAYGIAEAGSDWNRFYIRDLKTGRDEPHVLDFIKFSGLSWTHDSDGFFYSRYPGKDGVFDELRDQALYYHRRGTPQAMDVRVFDRPQQPRWGFSGEVSRDGRYLLISVWEGASENNALYVRDMKHADRPFLRGALIPVVEDFAAKFEPIGVDGTTLYLLTTQDAPNGRIVAIDLQRPQQRREIVAEGEDAIESARYANGRIAITVMHDAVHQLKIHDHHGTLQQVLSQPGMASLDGMALSEDGNALYTLYESFVTPEQQLKLDLATGERRVVNQPVLPFKPDNYVTRQVFYTSRDGTRVPMFLTHRRDLDLSRPKPTYLYGYGGFSIALTPFFKASQMAWLEQGGVYAVANLRGGSEYGQAWHLAGTRAQKQNVFDDFIAAAEYLIDERISSPQQLGIVGRSNGGLLVGAVSNQRPELFAAAIPGVGVMDMLRFHKFTIGWAWTGDYGSSDEADMFPVLRAYSPYHNVPTGDDFPAVMVTTADHDDRVVPGHSFKYAAALQHANPGASPKLIRIESRAGHGRGMPVSKQIEQAADELAFMAAFTGLKLGSATPWSQLLERR